MSDLVSVETRGDIRLFGFNDPDRYNPFSVALLYELRDKLTQSLDEGVTKFVFFGHGKSFSSGADQDNYLKELEEIRAGHSAAFIESERLVIEIGTMFRRPKVFTVAAVHGWCVGFAAEFSTACDFVVTTPDSKFWFAETSAGWGNTFGATVRLPRIVGAGWAKRLMILSERISGETAERIGLAARLCEDSKLIDCALELIATADRNAPLATQYQKMMIDLLANVSENQALELEVILQHWLAHTGDVREAASAFLEKKDPDFKGR